jgi:hypothetical protein
MTDDRTGESAADASGDEPEADAHIRALLAELGSGPDGRSMPPEVAARLDDTLARLVAERGAGDENEPEPETEPGVDDLPDNVVPLRRRWLPALTAAAAAVVVLGVGGVAANNLGVFGNESTTAADGGASSSTAGGGDAATAGPQEGDSGEGGVVTAAGLPRLRSGSFDADVQGLLARRSPALATPEQPAAPDASASAGRSNQDKNGDENGDAPKDLAQGLRSRGCPGPRITDGAVPSPVRYDGRLAVLVIHPAQGGRQLVEAWDCGGVRRLATTTVAR